MPLDAVCLPKPAGSHSPDLVKARQARRHADNHHNKHCGCVVKRWVMRLTLQGDGVIPISAKRTKCLYICGTMRVLGQKMSGTVCGRRHCSKCSIKCAYILYDHRGISSRTGSFNFISMDPQTGGVYWTGTDPNVSCWKSIHTDFKYMYHDRSDFILLLYHSN